MTFNKIRYFSTALLIVFTTPIFSQNKIIEVYKNGEVVFSSEISEIDSITFIDVEPAVAGRVKSTLPVGYLTFLTYNLGADYTMTLEQQMAYHSTSAIDETILGSLYQWGRSSDLHQSRTSDTTGVLSQSGYFLPSLFIIAPTEPYNWLATPDDYRWNNPKTAEDPCPEGFRIPTTEEWRSIADPLSGNQWTWQNSNPWGYKISPDGGKNITLFLPAAGYREYEEGRLKETGLSGNYWSSTTDITAAYGLYFDYRETVPQNNYMRADGCSLRCVQEY